MRELIAILGICGALAIGPTAAEGRWRIDSAVGAVIPTDSVELRKGDDPNRVDKSSGVSFALGGGHGLSDWVDLMGNFQGSFAGLSGDSLDLYSLTGGGRVFLTPPGWLRPWLASGIGWYRVAASASIPNEGSFLFGPSRSTTNETDDSFGLNVGGGFDVFVHPKVSLGIDARYHNAPSAFGGFDFVTALFNVGVHLGE